MVHRPRGGRATLLVTPFRPLTTAERSDVEHEAAALLRFVAAAEGEHDVVVAPHDTE